MTADPTELQDQEAPQPSASEAVWQRWAQGVSSAGVGVGLLLLIGSAYMDQSTGIAAWGVGVYSMGLIIYFGTSVVGALLELRRRKPRKARE